VLDDQSLKSRRDALKCLAFGTGTLFALSGGVLAPIDLLAAAADRQATARLGKPLFVQISDTHIGFNKEANPDVVGTLTQTIDLVNAMPELPALVIHTGDITHLSKPAEFDLAQQLLARLRTTELHTTPGEHDTTDPTVSEYFNRFRKASNNTRYYSFDHAGVHFVSLVMLLVQARGVSARSAPPARNSAGLEGTFGQHPDRRVRSYAALDDLRTVGLGHR
jgi:hypothetical protein